MHTVGSLIVVFNSARLVRKGEELEHYQPEPAAPQAGTAGRARAQGGAGAEVGVSELDAIVRQRSSTHVAS